MHNLSKLLSILTVVLSLALITNNEALASEKADNYLITGSKNLVQADSFHVDFSVDISGKNYNLSAVTNSDIENKKQISKTDIAFNGFFKDKNFAEKFEQYIDLSQDKDKVYTFDGKNWTRMVSPKAIPSKMSEAEIKYIDYKIKTMLAGVISNEIILENSEYALINIKIITKKAEEAVIEEFYPQIKPIEKKQIDDVLRNVGDIDIIVKFNKRNGMIEEGKMDLSKPVATFANNIIDLWGGNNKNKNLYKEFFQGFNFVISTSYNRFNQIDGIVIPLEAKVGKLINAGDLFKTGKDISKAVNK